MRIPYADKIAIEKQEITDVLQCLSDIKDKGGVNQEFFDRYRKLAYKHVSLLEWMGHELASAQKRSLANAIKNNQSQAQNDS